MALLLLPIGLGMALNTKASIIARHTRWKRTYTVCQWGTGRFTLQPQLRHLRPGHSAWNALGQIFTTFWPRHSHPVVTLRLRMVSKVLTYFRVARSRQTWGCRSFAVMLIFFLLFLPCTAADPDFPFHIYRPYIIQFCIVLVIPLVCIGLLSLIPWAVWSATLKLLSTCLLAECTLSWILWLGHCCDSLWQHGRHHFYSWRPSFPRPGFARPYIARVMSSVLGLCMYAGHPIVTLFHDVHCCYSLLVTKVLLHVLFSLGWTIPTTAPLSAPLPETHPGSSTHTCQQRERSRPQDRVLAHPKVSPTYAPTFLVLVMPLVFFMDYDKRVVWKDCPVVPDASATRRGEGTTEDVSKTTPEASLVQSCTPLKIPDGDLRRRLRRAGRGACQIASDCCSTMLTAYASPLIVMTDASRCPSLGLASVWYQTLKAAQRGGGCFSLDFDKRIVFI